MGFQIRLSRRILLLTINIGLMAFFVFQALFTLPVQAGRLSQEITPTPTTSEVPVASPEVSWLSFPSSAGALASDRSLALLAGELIFRGLVDAGSCPANGLMKGGAASSCGEKSARNAVIVWQNQFDAAILDAANQTGVPPFLLKNVIAQETQFWPSSQLTIYGYPEVGLGHVTEMGADTLLRWSPAFEAEICKSVYAADTCKKPYAYMTTYQQASLRGMVMQNMNAICADCRGGVNLQAARRSILTIAAILRANYTHAQWVSGNLARSSGRSVNQALLWRFALAGYNAGPGCLTNALVRARSLSLTASWREISSQFDPACQSTITYIEKVTTVYQADPLALAAAAGDTSPATDLVNYYLQADYPELFVTPATPTPLPSATSTAAPSATVIPSPTVTLPPTAALDSPTPTSTLVEGTPGAQTPTPTQDAASVSATPTLAEETATQVSPTPAAVPTSTSETGPSATPTPAGEPGITSNSQILVRFANLVPVLVSDLFLQSAGAKVETRFDPLGLVLVSVPADRAEQALKDIRASIMVQYAEPNAALQAYYTPDDPGFASQFGYADMQIPQAWDVTRGENVVVALVDTGLDQGHPEFAGGLWVNPGETGPDANGNDRATNGLDDDGDGYVDNASGWNFLNNSADVTDLQGHGTHLAGLITARMDNGQGLAGVAPAARLMPLKALNDAGQGTTLDVARAIVYAVDHGARIINLGLGSHFDSAALRAATDYAFEHNVTVVAAAGNDANNTPVYPAANPHVIAVAALDAGLGQAPFASSGSFVQLAAPGLGLNSTLPGGQYGLLSGSSMSAAQVSGIAALLASQPQFDTPDKIRAALVETARDLGETGRDDIFGYGLPRAYDALSYTPNGLVTPTPAITPTEISVPPLRSRPLAADAANASIANYALSCTTASPAYTTQMTGTNIAIGTNNTVSGALNIGFDFWYMGTRYTQFYASENGWISLSAPANSLPTNDLNTTGGTARPIIAPLWDDLNGIGTGGAARYATTGTAPNRVLTIEWWNWRWSNAAANISFRVMLYENTGAVSFVYYTGAGTDPTTGSASIGLTGFSNGVFRSIQSIPAAAATCPAFTTPEVATLSTRPVTSQQWTFTPPQTPALPGSMSMNTVAPTSLNLTWQDNATNETGYAIYNSTNGTTWTYIGQTAANATTYAATGLTSGTSYYWRVLAVTEGGLSTAPSLAAPGALSFSNVLLNSMTVTWPDNSANETGFLVMNSTDGSNFAPVAVVPANATATASYNATGLSSGVTYTWRVMAITPGMISVASTASQATAFASTQPPLVTIISPLSGASARQNTQLIFQGSAIVPTNGDVSSSLQWTSSIDGVIGSGASFATSNLSAGTHTITASITDVYGRVSQATATLTIQTFDNPHSAYALTTDKCAYCHLPHTAQTERIIDFNQSPLTSNAFCMKCHGDGGGLAPVVSTHSNIDWPGGSASSRLEAPFEILCVQCHDPHGSTNLHAIRRPDNAGTTADDAYSGVRITMSPLVKANVVFTSPTGADSYDEVDGAAPADGGAAANADDLCVTCHSNSVNPGFPMARHDGGYHTSSPYLAVAAMDQRGVDCTSCHPHSLDATPSTRDGFMTGCRACHSQAQNNGDNIPPAGRRQIVGATGGGDFTRTSHHVSGSDAVTDEDCLVCHEMTQHKSGTVRLFNADNSATVYTLSPVLNPVTDAAAYENFCISCHDANGRNGSMTPFSDKKLVPSLNSLWASARHNVLVATFNGSCIDCHDNGHGSNKLKLLKPWNATAGTAPDAMVQEEKFCYQCHSAAGPGRQVDTSFSLYTNTATSIYKHDVSVDNGLNHNKEVFGSSFANRHVECGDCHEPHIDAFPNTATAPAVKLSQRGASGVAPNWPAAGGAPTGYSFLPQAANEYQVCFKCHSSYTTLAGYNPTGLAKLANASPPQMSETKDLAREFNPATSNPNASFHPVTAAGKNTGIAANTFVAPWTATSRVYCSDCHTNAAATAAGNAGPHGSPRLHILAGTVDYITVDNNNTNGIHNTGELCFKCHQYNTYVNSTNDTNFGLHQTHNFAACYDCHDSHGSDNPRLVNFNTAHVTFTGGRNSQTAIDFTTKSCTLSCHGQNHNGFNYP